VPSPSPAHILRRSLRQRRRDLSPLQQICAARRLCRHIVSSSVYRQARHLALYQAADGEIDPRQVLRHAHRHGKHCYLPVLHPLRSARMLFVRYRPGARLRRNRWGIAEPRLGTQRLRPAYRLDLVLVPLVGFDWQGNRIGMGKGYYDRCFAFRRKHHGMRPALLGLAHDCQAVAEGIKPSTWDITMDALATPERFQPIRRTRLLRG
jgi:5-formyltetrahydrofolate cyclo-ligase